MGMLRQILCLFFGHLIAAHSLMRYGDPMVAPDFGGFFENNEIFPIQRHFDFPPFDAIFSSWTPDLNVLAEFSPFLNLPRVQVSCDESKLTVLVGKKAFGISLTADEVQLGDGCYSNGELKNQFVFAYSLEECGTTPVFQNGLQLFTNSLHLNLKKALPTWWQAPPTVYISCIPKRLNKDPDSVSTPLVNAKRFNIQAMNPSWKEVAQSNIYTRGQELNLQVSAKTRPDQQLFIQSCFTSASPEARTRPRHAVILNKGCSSLLAAPLTVAQFTASNRADLVNFILTASNLTSELYIHCSVVVSEKGVTSATKSCNYNGNQLRWEELSGDVEVCSCCSSKCKGPSVKTLPDDAKAVVSIGPFIILDNGNNVPPDSESQTSTTASKAIQSSDLPSDGDMIVSGSSVSRNTLSSQDVVVVSQEPSARLTLWLPGQVHGKYSKKNSQSEDGRVGQLPSDDSSELQLLAINEQVLVELPTNEVVGQTLKDYSGGSLLSDVLLPVVDSLPIPEMSGNELFTEHFQRKRFGRSGTLATGGVEGDTSQTNSVNLILDDQPTSAVETQKKLLPAESESNDLNPRATHTVAEPSTQEDPVMSEDADAEPIIRSKLEYSKSADGSLSISYEEEVKRQEDKCVQGRPKRSVLTGKREPGLKGLRPTFLSLLRMMDKAE